jgi:hypothetical protein
MFTLLRGVAIVGLIFYFSPARQTGAPQGQPDREESRPVPVAAPSTPVEAREGAWNRLVGSLKEEVVRTAVNEKTLSAGLRLSAARPLMEASPKPASADRVRPFDQEWPLRPGQDPSVRCVYRCDGAE